jgi:dTDP-glucose pyrophosphorylase
MPAMYDRISQCCVPISRTLIDAMRVIEEGSVGVALVIDPSGRLVGMLTDGDIRRGILQGASLESPLEPHVRRRFTSVTPSAGRAEVLDLMQSLVIHQVPVVDENGRVVGLHLLHELLGGVERPHWAVIMAGGRGTRLAPLTETIPKPMVRVAGRPILERLVLHLVGFGIRRIFLSVHYLAEVISGYFGDGSKFGCRIEYLRETESLGTGGALSLLKEMPSSPLLVLNGDLVTQVNLADMLDFHARGRFMATMGVRQYTHQVPFGCVELRGDRVVSLEEKPILDRCVNAGIYILEPGLLSRVPKASYPITALFEDCLAKSEPVGAFEIREDWIDVGHREQLKQAQHGPG